MFAAAVPTRAEPGGQPERPPMAARLKTRRVAHAGVLVGKREAVLPFAMTGLDRGDNMLSEVSQAEEDGYVGPHLHATLKQDETNTHLLGTERRLGAVRGAAVGTAVFSWVWGPPVPGTAPCTAPSSFRPAGHRPPPQAGWVLTVFPVRLAQATAAEAWVLVGGAPRGPGC